MTRVGPTVKEALGGCPDECPCDKALSVCPNCGAHIVKGSEDFHVKACLRLNVLLGIDFPVRKDLP